MFSLDNVNFFISLVRFYFDGIFGMLLERCNGFCLVILYILFIYFFM